MEGPPAFLPPGVRLENLRNVLLLRVGDARAAVRAVRRWRGFDAGLVGVSRVVGLALSRSRRTSCDIGIERSSRALVAASSPALCCVAGWLGGRGPISLTCGPTTPAAVSVRGTARGPGDQGGNGNRLGRTSPGKLGGGTPRLGRGRWRPKSRRPGAATRRSMAIFRRLSGRACPPASIAPLYPSHSYRKFIHAPHSRACLAHLVCLPKQIDRSAPRTSATLPSANEERDADCQWDVHSCPPRGPGRSIGLSLVPTDGA